MYKYPTLEFALFVLYSFTSYLLAEALSLSGIVAILFCGITMAHYTRKNLSVEAKHLSIHFWEILATLAETYVFLYLGLSIFSVWGDYDIVMIAFAIPLCLIARALHIFPISGVFNLFCKARYKRKGVVTATLAIPMTHQAMMWFSGLRGAIAFALAMDLQQRLASSHGAVILTTTIIIVVFSVTILGALTAKMLELLHIQIGDTLAEEDSPYKVSWWRTFDKQYIKPFFTRPSNPELPKKEKKDVQMEDFDDLGAQLEEEEAESSPARAAEEPNRGPASRSATPLRDLEQVEVEDTGEVQAMHDGVEMQVAHQPEERVGGAGEAEDAAAQPATADLSELCSDSDNE